MATCPTCRAHYPDGLRHCATDGQTLLPDEAFANADADVAIGQMVGEYRIEGRLGEGAFGVVYRAVHPLIGKAAAIKVLNRQYSSNPQMVSRFIAEARAVNQIRHRNIIDIFSFGALEDGRQYYVMELLEGMTFDKYLEKKGRLAPDEAIPLLRGIARALDAAHAHGIAHRDLKPENVFLVFDEDAGVFPKLLDFGIAKLLGDTAGGGHKTRTGTPMGTPNYMSPEQCRGQNVDHRTDIYSFGIVVHETLTGRLPFQGEAVMDLLLKHTTAPAPPLSTVCPDLPQRLDAPLLAMLEKDPDARPPSLVAAIDALGNAAREAGYDIPVPGQKGAGFGGAESATSSSGAGIAAVARSGAGVSSSPLAQARTVAQSEAGKTFSASATDVRPPKGRGKLFAGAGALAIAAGIGVVVLALRKSPPPSPSPSPAQAPPVAASAAVVADKPAGPGAPATAPSVEVAMPAEVAFTVESTPPGVDVYLGTEKLGTAPGPIQVKHGDAKVKLTFKAPGYKPTDVEVVPSAGTLLSVTLLKLPPKQAGKPEIEF
jgi:eukaryotic-like serine/threonine-protein kinase